MCPRYGWSCRCSWWRGDYKAGSRALGVVFGDESTGDVIRYCTAAGERCHKGGDAWPCADYLAAEALLKALGAE